MRGTIEFQSAGESHQNFRLSSVWSTFFSPLIYASKTGQSAIRDDGISNAVVASASEWLVNAIALWLLLLPIDFLQWNLSSARGKETIRDEMIWCRTKPLGPKVLLNKESTQEKHLVWEITPVRDKGVPCRWRQ